MFCDCNQCPFLAANPSQHTPTTAMRHHATAAPHSATLWRMNHATFDQLDYRQDLDDRVVCNGCPNRVATTQQQRHHKDKADGKRIAFESDKVVRVGDWVTVSWREWVCKVGLALDPQIHTMPDGVLHRCSLIKPPHYQDTTTPAEAATAPQKATAAQWWE